MIAHVAVEVLQTSGPLGVATVVRVVDGDAMVAEARSICRKFDLSGLHGFDFVIDQDSGIAKLIEINARATQTGHFPLGPGRDLAAAFFTVFSGGRDGVGRPSMKPGDIALFPQEWLRDPQSSYLTSAFHDVPAADPELARFYGYEHLGPRAVAVEPELLETVA